MLSWETSHDKGSFVAEGNGAREQLMRRSASEFCRRNDAFWRWGDLQHAMDEVTGAVYNWSLSSPLGGPINESFVGHSRAAE